MHRVHGVVHGRVVPHEVNHLVRVVLGGLHVGGERTSGALRGRGVGQGEGGWRRSVNTERGTGAKKNTQHNRIRKSTSEAVLRAFIVSSSDGLSWRSKVSENHDLELTVPGRGYGIFPV